MSVVLPCRCCNVAVGWHFHTAKFCAQSLNLYPGILKYFTIPYKNISILIKLQFRQNIWNILLLFQSKYFKWTKYFLTASASLEEMISCRARTERACSITNTHWERSGGTFCEIVKLSILNFCNVFYVSTYLVHNALQEALPVPESLSRETNSLARPCAGETHHVLLERNILINSRQHSFFL